MKWARMKGNRALEVVDTDPTGRFDGSIQWTEVPDEVTPNSVRQEDGSWEIAAIVKPRPRVSARLPPPKVSPIEFKLLFTAQERVAIKEARATDAIIDDFMELIEDPRLTHVDMGLTSTQQAIQHLADQAVIEPSRVEAILSGAFQ